MSRPTTSDRERETRSRRRQREGARRRPARGLPCVSALAAGGAILAGALLAAPALAEPDLAELIQRLPAQDEATRDQVFKQLVALGPNGVVQLAGMLQEPGKGDDSKVRYALHGMALYVTRPGASQERKAFGQALAAVLAGGSLPAGVKAFLIQQARIAGGPEVVKVLGAHLLDPVLCEDAAQALLTIGEGAVEQFRSALGRVQGQSLKTVVQALGVLRDAESAGALVKLASVQDRDLRLTVLHALGNIGDPAAAPTLVKAASVESPYERACATDALLLLARRLAEDGHKEESLKLYRALWKERSDAEEPHVRVAALQGAAEAEAMKVKPKPARPTGAAKASEPSQPAAAASKPIPEIDAGLLAAWDAKLRAKAAEALRAGARPNLYIEPLKKRVMVSGIDPEGALKVSVGNVETSVPWARLTPSDKKGLALAFLDDDPRSHALAAFYLLALGSDEAAARHLRMAGDHADAVKEAFGGK